MILKTIFSSIYNEVQQQNVACERATCGRIEGISESFRYDTDKSVQAQNLFIHPTKVFLMPLLHRCMTKATTAEGDDIRRSLNWVMARRGILKVYDNHLELGSWHLSYSDFDEAILFSIRQTLIPGYVLKIKTQGTIYQFGLNYNRFWKKELPFAVERRAMKLKLSWFSMTIRVVSLAGLGYLIWQFFTS